MDFVAEAAVAIVVAAVSMLMASTIVGVLAICVVVTVGGVEGY